MEKRDTLKRENHKELKLIGQIERVFEKFIRQQVTIMRSTLVSYQQVDQQMHFS